MTYDEFTQYLAKYGFINNPLSQEQFKKCHDNTLSLEGVYGIACDMCAGIDFDRAYEINRER